MQLFQYTFVQILGQQADDPLPESLPACPKGFIWHKDSNHCYRLESDRITWQAAKDSCQSLGSELVAVETAREQRFLNKEASKRAGKLIRIFNIWKIEISRL